MQFQLPKKKKTWDCQKSFGEKGYTLLNNYPYVQLLDVNGIWGGYTGEGAKAIILPSSKCENKSMRLVLNNHLKIAALLQNILRKLLLTP